MPTLFRFVINKLLQSRGCAQTAELALSEDIFVHRRSEGQCLVAQALAFEHPVTKEAFGCSWQFVAVGNAES